MGGFQIDTPGGLGIPPITSAGLANMPAAENPQIIFYVSDAAGGLGALMYSDGVRWRRLGSATKLMSVTLTAQMAGIATFNFADMGYPKEPYAFATVRDVAGSTGLEAPVQVSGSATQVQFEVKRKLFALGLLGYSGTVVGVRCNVLLIPDPS